jgi:hypothetical protein
MIAVVSLMPIVARTVPPAASFTLTVRVPLVAERTKLCTRSHVFAPETGVAPFSVSTSVSTTPVASRPVTVTVRVSAPSETTWAMLFAAHCVMLGRETVEIAPPDVDVSSVGMFAAEKNGVPC